MRLTEQELKELQQQRTARSARGATECLTEDALIRAASKELGREERKRVVRHLRNCSDCAREYRVAHSLKPWSQKVAPISDKMAASPIEFEPWQASQPQPRIEQMAAHPAGRQRFAAIFSSVRLSHAIMALLFILSLALGAWVISLRRERQELASRLNEQPAGQASEVASARESLEETRRRLEEAISRAEQDKSNAAETEERLARYEEEMAGLRRSISKLSRPQLDAPIVDLDPAPEIRGRPEERATEVEVPETANLFTLILNFTDENEHSRYEVELLSREGHKIWSGQRARKGRERNLNVTLSKQLFSEGRYVIKLYGLSKGKKELVADYSMMIKYQ